MHTDEPSAALVNTAVGAAAGAAEQTIEIHQLHPIIVQ